ncbi:MAG: hypothetical protein ABL951_05660 [Alphaproteobacteria bacterium]
MQTASSYLLGGGLDLVTPAIAKKPGVLIAGLNHEPRPEGYRRIDGFERRDGRPSPTDSRYWILNFTTGTAGVAEGDTVTGLTSAATGKALVASVVTSGSYGGGDAAGYLVLTVVSGTFQNAENLQVAAVTKCVASGTAVQEGAGNDTDDTTWKRDAIETARALISTVPGQGSMRGAWMHNGIAYAVRDNVGATAGVLHKETTAGWTAVALGRSLTFTSGGAYVIAEGNTITGATSAATAVITRVVLVSGSWAGGDAAGRLIFASQTGTFQAENLNVGANLNVATIAGNSSAITLPAGGRYEFRNHNFLGGSATQRMYGVNGVGTAFEFDGTVFVPIFTGMTVDTPNHIEIHKGHLFLAFPGGSLQHSGVGAPYAWSVILGAAELGIGDDITGLLSGYARAMVIFGRNSTNILFGSSSADWELDNVSNESGAVEWTSQMMLKPVYYDDGGVRSLAATQAFGDFQVGVLSEMVQPLVNLKKRNSLPAVASLRVKSKNQYRLFYSDGSCLVMDMSAGQRKPEFAPLNYGKVIRCCASVEASDGSEALLFGSDDGYIYHLDKGTSFDGAEVEAYLRLAFNNIGSPHMHKRFFGASAQVTASSGTEIFAAADFSYAGPDQVGTGEVSSDVEGGGGFWDEMIWDEFRWDSPAEGVAYLDLFGKGKNIGFAFYSDLTYEEPYVIHAVTVNYSTLKLDRRRVG